MKHLSNAGIPFKYVKERAQKDLLKNRVIHTQLNHRPIYFRFVPPRIVNAIFDISIENLKITPILDFHI